MGYHIDDNTFGLDRVAAKLEASDLIPSQVPLLDGIRAKMAALEKAGITSLAKLRSELRRPAKLAALATRCGLTSDYLNLLRRAVEGWFPKPPSLADFPGVQLSLTTALDRLGLADAQAFFEAAATKEQRAALAMLAAVPGPALDELAALADLSRIQWVSPLFARLLYDAGFPTVAAVGRAEGQAVYEAASRLNHDNSYYRGKVGLRDMARLVGLAQALPIELDP